MIQIAIPVRARPLALCECGARPQHVALLGQGNAPRAVGQFRGHGVRHRIECSRCGARTEPQASFRACLDVWGMPGEQVPLKLTTRALA